jgi:cell division cycle 14
MIIDPSALKNEHWNKEIFVFLAQCGGMPEHGQSRTFDMEQFAYDAFCDDFGPINILECIRFMESFEREITHVLHNAIQNIVCTAAAGRRECTNAAFMLGVYLLLKLNMPASSIANCFRGLDANQVEKYRDAGFEKPDFGLRLVDCWRALERARNKGWLRYRTLHTPYLWGMIDKDAYDHYDNPLNADLHEIVPCKILVFRGPKDLGGPRFQDRHKAGVFVSRDFSPEYFAETFKELGVSTIIRLNSPQYDQRTFVDMGYEHYDLDFDGRSTPPSRVMSEFFKIVDNASGVVAVHGRESLGRAGTLAALFLMRSHSFNAREAMAWVRVMRPGSILGEQQHYLARMEQFFVSVSDGTHSVSRACSHESAHADGDGREMEVHG